MEEIKLRFADAIAAQLTAAPDSSAKSELVEELADNLYQRYLDLTASGKDSDEAFRLAMDDLGDMDELLEYLNSDAKDEEPARGTGDPLGSFMRDVEEIIRNAGEITKNALKDLNMNIRSQRGRVYVNIEKDGGERPEHPYREDRGRTATCEMPAAGLTAVEIEEPNGDITLAFDQPEDGNAVISGKLSLLEIESTPGGKLTVRREKTASAESMLRRGLGRTDIELSLPRRDWDSVRVVTACGDVEIDGSIRAGKVTVNSASGDINVELESCGELRLNSASGDIAFNGSSGEAFLNSASGDQLYEGPAGTFKANTVSGDVEFTGTAVKLKCASVSGDLRLELSELPETVEASTKSGDCEVRIPDMEDAGFRAELRTVSGDVDSEFPVTRISGGTFVAVSGGGRNMYSVSTVSGDIELQKY